MVLLNGAATRPAAVLHVDLDGGPEIFAAHGWRWPQGDDPLFRSGLTQTLALLDELDIRATLFVIARALDDPARRALVEEAVRRGHRIASHTLTHRWLPELSEGERRAEIRDSRSRLADLFGVPVDGFRAPGFGLTDAMLDDVREAGYRWDSSRFATAGRAAPYAIRGDLVEVPLPGYRPLPLPWHPSYSLVLGNWYFRLGLGWQSPSAPLVVLLHLTDLADPLPADYLPGWKARIFTLSHVATATKRARCRAMLELVGARYRWTETEALLAPLAARGSETR